MNNIITNFFVIFAVSASAELAPSAAQQAPYLPSGWRPSGPEFRYQSRPESRAFALASLNVQIPQPSSRLTLPEQQSWDSRIDFSTPSQPQDSWNKPQFQPDSRTRTPSQQPAFSQSSNRDQHSQFPADSRSGSPAQQPFNPQSSSPDERPRYPDQISISSAGRFGTRNPEPEQQPSYLPPSASDVRVATGSSDNSGSTPSQRGFSNSDQSSYLPPHSSQYRSLSSSLFLSPPEQFRAIPYTEYGPPLRQYKAAPSQEYGPPPSQEYGPPSSESTTTNQPTTETPTTTEVGEATTTELPVIEDARKKETSANAIEGEERSQKLTQNEEQGIYYVYHPSGLLQRISYTTNDDQEGMVYSARLRYENVEPINGPIYTYDPETYVFKKVN